MQHSLLENRMNHNIIDLFFYYIFIKECAGETLKNRDSGQHDNVIISAATRRSLQLSRVLRILF